MATSDEEKKGVMHLFRKGRPLTLAQVANKLSWSETRAEWVLTDMCERGDLFRTKNGKYGLVKARKKEPVPRRFRQGELQQKVLVLMSDGNVWRSMELQAEIPGMTSARICSVLKRLTELEKVRRISFGKYVREDVTVAEESPQGPTEPQEVEVSAAGRILGDIHVNVNITCSSLEEARAVMRHLAKAMKGADGAEA
jgi:predicted transcriptional regulator of viral defense system